MTQVEVNSEVKINDTDQKTNLKEETFDYQDDTTVQEVTDETENYKYTKIDCLDEDQEIKGQKFVLLSFVSPEGVMNCKVRGVKVRGVYPTENEARAACDKLKQSDKYFDIFVGEMGKWLPWDPTPEQVKEVKFRNKKLDKIMNKIHETEINTLNEVVGRKKEMLDMEKVNHKNRIKQSIKESANTYNDPTPIQQQEDEKVKKVKNQKNDDNIRQRLRKMVEEREKTKAEQQQSGLVDVNDKKKKLKEESDRIQQKEQNIEKLKQSSSEIDDKLKKMKQYYDQKKSESAN
jgi:hypothetical protein